MTTRYTVPESLSHWGLFAWGWHVCMPRAVQDAIGLTYAENEDLGLPVGDWPEDIAVVDDSGEGHTFSRNRAIRAGDDEFQGVIYTEP